ncbi:MAG: sporulation protein YqfD, partial [Clostridia bacterium]|nr:sporulation protein YqfD [Clostridia bacterium]
MKSGKIFNFLTGNLTLCADGPFAERLINIFKNRGFPIWDIKRCGSCRILFKTDIPSFKHIRTPARRTKSRVRIIKRNGLPFILNRYKHRYFLAPGIAIFAIMLFYASTHIMGITVFGNTRIDTDVINSALEECGLYLGAKTSAIDNDTIRNKMMLKFDELAWIGINANGSRVYIEIVERVEKESGLDKDGIACNLIASKDGEIESIEIREGQTVVKTGSGVRKGDVLVSGIVDNATNGFRYVKARGEVFAKTTYTKTQA